MSTIAPHFRATDAQANVQEEVLCAHCTLPVPAGLVESGAQHQFCCEGCRAVYNTITGCGLADYYRLRETAGELTVAPASPGRTKFDGFDAAAFEALYVTADDGRKQTELVLEGLTCGACVWLLEKLPDVMPGLIEARLSLRDARLRVTWMPEQVSLSKIATLLDRFGYTPHPARSVTKASLVRRAERQMDIDIGIAFALMGNLMLIAAALYSGWAGNMDAGMTQFLRWTAGVLGVASLAGPGRCFFINAWRSIRNRVMNLDLPIALALVAGLVAGVINTVLGRAETYFDSLSMLVFLLLVGRYIQHRQQRRADASVELLFNLMPSTVHVYRDGVLVDLPAAALQVDDLVEVRDGETLPGDGVIERGVSAIDQALLTGESAPVDAKPGDSVFAGAMNRGATLAVRLNTVGRATRVGKLMDLVEQGLAEKPEVMRFADRIGRWFIPAVLIAAGATFTYWSRFGIERAVDHSIAMLIVTCPCILGLATPLTMAASIGRLARRNVLVKSAAALEKLADVKTVVFDKTGTLTRGELRVMSYTGDVSLMTLIAEAEQQSRHPVGRAIAKMCSQPKDDRTLNVQRSNDLAVTAIGTSGISVQTDRGELLIGSANLMRSRQVEIAKALIPSGASELCTRVFVALSGRHVVTLALADDVREEARQTIDKLALRGIQTTLLSGDAMPVVQNVACKVGIRDARGEVTPEEKLQAIRTMREAGTVVMVGDGVNDAAALAAADVGIAVHGGAEASLSAADVYIATPGVAGVAELLDGARHTMKVIRRNFAITLCYNVFAGTLAGMGIMNPLIAAIIMPISSATTLGFAMAAVSRQRPGKEKVR